MDRSPASLVGDGMWMAVGQVLSTVSAVVMSMVAVRSLQAEGFAALVWLLACLAYLGSIARLGTMQSAARVLAMYDNDRRGAVSGLLAAPLVVSIGLAVLWRWFVGPLVVGWTEQGDLYGVVFDLLALWLPFAVLGPTVGAVLRARGRFAPSVLTGEWVRRSVLAVAFLIGRGGEPVQLIRYAVLAAIAFEVVLVVGGVGVALVGTGRSGGHRWPSLDPARQSMPFYVGSVVNMLIPQSGVWLLAFVAGPGDVADYGIAARLSFFFVIPVLIGSTVMVPRIARSARNNRLPELEATLQQYCLVATGLVTVALLGFVAVGRPVISLLFGDAYAGGYLPGVMLAAGVLVTAATGLSGAVLANAGHAWLTSTVMTVLGVVFVIVGLGAGAAFGAVGMAAAAMVLQMVQNVAVMYLALTRTGIHTGLPIQWLGTKRAKVFPL